MPLPLRPVPSGGRCRGRAGSTLERTAAGPRAAHTGIPVGVGHGVLQGPVVAVDVLEAGGGPQDGDLREVRRLPGVVAHQAHEERVRRASRGQLLRAAEVLRGADAAVKVFGLGGRVRDGG